MNLPVGEVVSRDLILREMDIRRLVEGFFDKKFSGYIIDTCEGYDGIEEGVLIFKDGELIASLFEYEFHGITVFGDTAIPHVFNSFAAVYVVADIVSLSNQQVDLVTAFNDKSKLLKPVSRGEIGRLIPKVYSGEYAKAVLTNVVKKEETKVDIFKKLGLSGLGE